MFWQLYFLLAAFTPIALHARVLPKREQAHHAAVISPENPLNPCSVNSHSDPSERICHPDLFTQTTPLPVTKPPRHEGGYDPLGFFLRNPSKWCPAGQYCDLTGHPRCRPQGSFSTIVRTVSTPSVVKSSTSGQGLVERKPAINISQVSLSHYSDQKLHSEVGRRCDACGKPGGAEIFYPTGENCDRIDCVCHRAQQTFSLTSRTVSPRSATLSSSFTANQDHEVELINIRNDKVANHRRQGLPPYDQRQCYPFGDYGGPEKWCPAGQYCDVIDYSCRPDARVVSEVARTALVPWAMKSASPGSYLNFVEEPFDLPKLAAMPGSGSGPGPSSAPRHPNPGTFTVVGSSGVPAMHAGLMPNGRVFFLDKVENYSPISIANGRLAFSSEFDPATRQVVPLAYTTNAFCSAGAFLADGRVISVGGNGPLSYLDPTVSDGFDGIRYLQRSATDKRFDGSSWSEPGNKLASKRWYASAQTMPDGSVFVISGSLTGLVITDNANNNPTYELLDANGTTTGRNVAMDILVKNQPYYLYPFVHLLRDGSLFVFSSKSSQIFRVRDDRIVKEMPDLVGLYRTYPNSGGSVMLPLTSQTGYAADVIVCGGGAWVDVSSPTDASCGRIQPESDTPSWEMDAMPEGRVMVEGTLLPDGTVLWLNGAQIGAQGFGIADDPALEALIYNPEEALGQRWNIAGESEIPRLYHSVALLLLDGTILVAGGNPNEQPVLPQDVNPSVVTQKYPTEYRVEIYTPPYLVGDKATRRPQNILISMHTLRADGSVFEVTFTAPQGGQDSKVLLNHGGFVTHGLHMGQRMVVLDHESVESEGGQSKLRVQMPEARFGNNVLPPGPYVLYVVLDGVPSVGQFVMVE